MTSYIAGFSLGLSLILAIGAQNAFVLKQGLRRHHVFLVSLICAVSDALLITAGVLGFGAVVQQFPQVEILARYAGAAFLIAYGLRSLYSAFTTSHALDPEGEDPGSALNAVLVCLAFTWLNPHVYLDTVVLLGSISTQYEGSQLQFGAGAVTSSFVFFFSLGYGARFRTPIFHRPVSWKVLELVIAAIMFLIATQLLLGAF